MSPVAFLELLCSSNARLPANVQILAASTCLAVLRRRNTLSSPEGQWVVRHCWMTLQSCAVFSRPEGCHGQDGRSEDVKFDEGLSYAGMDSEVKEVARGSMRRLCKH